MSALTELHDAVAALETNSERNTRGQFKPGNKGGPGNPFAGKVSLLRKAVLECVSSEDLHGIIKSLVQMAKDGHWQAAKLILAYAIGKPGSLPEPGAWDGMEMAPFNPPSTNGISAEPPLTNGVFEESPPSANGMIEEPPPSANGESQPALNRKQRRALRKARRLAKSKRNTPPPVTAPLSNGLQAVS